MGMALNPAQPCHLSGHSVTCTNQRKEIPDFMCTNSAVGTFHIKVQGIVSAVIRCDVVYDLMPRLAASSVSFLKVSASPKRGSTPK